MGEITTTLSQYERPGGSDKVGRSWSFPDEATAAAAFGVDTGPEMPTKIALVIHDAGNGKGYFVQCWSDEVGFHVHARETTQD